MKTVKMYDYEPTPDEVERAAAKRKAENETRARFDKEMATTFSNKPCPICGHRFMAGVVCRKHGGSVCMSHCRECEHFNPTFWHCLFREEEAGKS